MTSESLGEMLKGDSADKSAGKFLLVLMGGQADTSSVRRRGSRTPIGASGNFYSLLSCTHQPIQLCRDIGYWGPMPDPPGKNVAHLNCVTALVCNTAAVTAVGDPITAKGSIKR